MATAVRSSHSRTAQLFHALSDEIRLEVIDLLGGGERCVCELTDALDIAQPRLSWHLKTLKDVGLVTDRRDGRWVHYSLNREAFEEAVALLAQLKPNGRRLQTRSSCC
ncbi:MAG TPA: metalloregulator ArsR/SmtB family transcription factor [Gemmatimonadaceae bacterium]|nr:metalloregulator ArsR/SmtB family transcription factor [Gemmatimonadaceae bacterium]